ncbi:Hypothetical predicted protein, partial [Marmota monax]
MSSGYSSLEEDAEDFFFTARTSFFRRAPRASPVPGSKMWRKRRKFTITSAKSAGTVTPAALAAGTHFTSAAPTLWAKSSRPCSQCLVTLYKRCHREDQVYACKPSDREHPLHLRLVAGPRTHTLSFVLREHEIGEWEAFRLPELQNFLRILDQEEDEQLQNLRGATRPTDSGWKKPLA